MAVIVLTAILAYIAMDIIAYGLAIAELEETTEDAVDKCFSHYENSPESLEAKSEFLNMVKEINKRADRIFATILAFSGVLGLLAIVTVRGLRREGRLWPKYGWKW